jgi:polar amino acid transport system substrate-binding protein
MAMRPMRGLLLVAALALPILAGCSGTVPADPDGTLERVRGGTLHVGVSPNEPWTDVHDGADPSGIDVDLVRGFASSIDATVEWTEGGEHVLMAGLELGELDLVIGGLTSDSPWVEKAALTVPFTEEPGAHGRLEKHVFAAPMGENAFLLELEMFLLAQEDLP